MPSSQNHNISFLDFLRGWAAVLVFFHHAAILGGGPDFLIGDVGKEAVNAFMFASGFLIFLQVQSNPLYQGLSNKNGIFTFYIRRFFRIAPLYYLCLIFALGLAPCLGQSRVYISHILGSGHTSLDRYYIAQPIESLLIHLSFIFGLLPKYAFSTPLPDWSLGLEMQFYLIFPLLFSLYKKHFALFFLISIFAFEWILNHNSSFVNQFKMPSFLPMMFYNFATGILLAKLYLDPKKNLKHFALLACSTTLLYCKIGLGPIFYLFIFSYSWICFFSKKTNVLCDFTNKLFAHSLTKKLAEYSYALYIIHLIFMLPFFAFLLKGGRLNSLKWFISTLALFGFCLFLSHFAYKFVEIPGINLGKRISKSFKIKN